MISVWINLNPLSDPYIPAALFVAAIMAFTATHAVLYKRDSRAAALWATLICLLPGVGVGLYLLVGINRVQRRAMRLKQADRRLPHLPLAGVHSLAPEPVLPAALFHLKPLAHAVRGLVRQPLLAGNRFEILRDGDAAFPAMLEEIAAARHSISLSSYLFGADQTGLAFVTALQAAVRRGVQVRVLIDASTTLFARGGIFRALRNAGVPCARFLPVVLHWPPVAFHLRNHRKLLVIDGCRGFTGGMNIVAAHWLGRRPARPASDIQFRITGPVVAHLQDAFADDWFFATGEVLEGEPWFPPLEPAGTVLARGIASGPDERIETLRWSLLAATASARHSLRILTPYFVPDPTLISALNTARRRGVTVDVVLPQNGDVPFVQWASAAQWWQMLEHGCRIWLAPPPFDHAKLFIVDDAWSLIGSANWDARSLRLNFEFSVECYDEEFSGQLVTLFETRRQASREITLADADARPLRRRLRDSIARLAAPFL